MSTHSRPSQHGQPSSSLSSTLSSSQASALQARIAQKRDELTNLVALRDLSAQVASQMEVLGQKLATLDEGFEAVAEVMGNWGAVLGVLRMVGERTATAVGNSGGGEGVTGEGVSGEGKGEGSGGEKLQTLVRIPVDVPRDVIDEIKDGSEKEKEKEKEKSGG